MESLLTEPIKPAARKFSVDEYYLMAEAGILRPKEQVELLDAQILCMAFRTVRVIGDGKFAQSCGCCLLVRRYSLDQVRIEDFQHARPLSVGVWTT